MRLERPEREGNVRAAEDKYPPFCPQSLVDERRSVLELSCNIPALVPSNRTGYSRMNHFRLVALVVATSALGVAHAQDEERRAPPVEIPDFSNLDEYIYEPRSTVTLGFRHLSGATASFSGQGSLPSPQDPGEATGANLLRTYNDGAVQPDSRGTLRTDDEGNVLIDINTGQSIFDPIEPDGRTNTWSYLDNSQRLSSTDTQTLMAFHAYSAEVIDATLRESKSANTNGLDLTVARDMGSVFGTRIAWTLMAGLSINDISAGMSDSVLARIQTLTDIYTAYDPVVPDAPYSAPSFATVPLVDSEGNPVLNEDGSTQTTTVETTVLLDSEPSSREVTDAASDTAVTNRWSVKGAFYTFRAGPTLWVPISHRLRASVSFGAAVVYAGTNYTVTQTFQPETGAEFSNTNTSSANKVLPGYYADATVQFDLTERAGFFAGAVMQSAGSYTQSLESPTANYSTKIDLGNLNGVRAGMSIRF
jgi:hypothetical protein